MKAKIKQQKMRAAKAEREASKKDGYISKSIKFKDVGAEPNSEDEEFYDSDAMVYDSEEEAEQEALHQQEKQKYFMNGKEVGFVSEPE